MEEADQILFLGLRDVLSAEEFPADLAASRDVGCDLFVRCCARCLRAIAPDDDAAAVPDRLPADMSGRFRVGTDLAVRIQRLGYRGDLGFHQLLYPNEADVRRVLTFLLDKVPKASATATPANGGAINAAARVQAALRAWVADGDKAVEPPAPQPFWTQPLSADDARVLVTSQPQPAARLTPSLLEAAASSMMLAARGAESELARLSATPGAPSSAVRAAAVRAAIAAGLGQKAVRRATAAGDDSRASRRADAAAAMVSPEAAPEVALTAEARLARGEEEVAALQAQLQRALDDFAAAEASAAAAEEEEAAAQRDAAAASAATPALEQEYLLRKQAAALLSGGRALDESEQELVRAIGAAKQRMQALEAEWAAVRRPFDERLAARDGAALRKRERAEAQLRQMQNMRGEIRELAAAARAREEEQRRLLTEYEAAPKSVNRAAFVKRIMEIIKNVKKQEVEIAKITADTRELQRDINAAQDALSRAYALVDETIFRDAKKDDASREAYRLLTSIHSGFADLAARVDETSRSGRTLRDLERKLEELLKRPLDLERIAADVKAVEAENATLGERLVGAGTGGA